MRDAWATRRSALDAPEAERPSHMSRARRDLTEAVDLCRAADDPVELAVALHLLANVEQDLGDDDAALALWREAVDLLRGAGEPLELAHKVRHLGDLHRRRSRLAEADACYEEAVAIHRGHDAPGSLAYANALRPMAMVKERLGDRAQARALWREARDVYAAVEGVDLRPALEECDRHLARLGGS